MLQNNDTKIKVVILGSGNIGTDLMVKVMRSPYLDCSLVIGRNSASHGLQMAKELGVLVSAEGISAIQNDPKSCEIVFDATSAKDHLVHWPILEKLGKMVIDMTPSKLGEIRVPAVDINKNIPQNVNMVSCGGQASIPLAHAAALVHQNIEYVEVVSSIASKSAGPATRINLDEYIETTEQALRIYTGCENTKVILILNPAEPCINMQTSVSIKVKNANLKDLNKSLQVLLATIQTYVPGYELIVPPTYQTNRIFMMVRVRGQGDYLPTYAGNLDIINCAAIAMAERYARQKLL